MNIKESAYKTLKRIPYTLWAFLIPAFLLCAIFAALHIAPFGNGSFIIGDANGYYINYLSYFRTILSGEHGLFFSFSKDLGGNLAGHAWGYLLSPYTWLFMLAGWDFFAECFSFSIILMNSLSGLMMYLCLAGIFKKRGSHLIFSTAYALCGFAVVNNYNIVFDVSLVCLPLVVLGLYKIFKDESPLLYILSLAYSIAVSIQGGFALCTASVIFFVAYLLMRYDEYREYGLRLVARFAIYSFCAGFLAAVVWLPSFMSLMGGRGSEGGISDFIFEDNAPLMEMGARLFSGASSTSQLIDGLPAIFCGILVVALDILFFLNKKIKKRDKIAAAAVLGIYILSFYIKTFTSVFQGFTHANWFNFRYSFVFSFVMIIIAVEEFSYIDEVETADLKHCVLIIAGAAVLIFSKEYDFVSGGNLIFDLAILSVMLFGIWYRGTHPDRASLNTLIVLLGLCSGLQLYANYYYSQRRIMLAGEGWKGNASEFQDDIDSIEPLVEGIETADKSFYRMENEKNRSMGNDPQMFYYNGVGQRNTGERTFVCQNLSRLGVSNYSAWNWYDKGIAPSMDSLLGIKYVLSENDLTEEKGYENRLTLFGTSIYENHDVLPIAILSEDEIKDISIEEEMDVFKIQNEIWQAMTGEKDDIYTPAKGLSYSICNATDDMTLTQEEIDELPEPESIASDEDDSSDTESERSDDDTDEERAKAYGNYIAFDFTATQDGAVYFYDSAAVTKDYGTLEDVLQYVGTYKAGDEVEGRIYLSETIDRQILSATAKGLYVYYANNDVLSRYSKILNSRDISIEKETDEMLTGEISTDKDCRVLFTIPYDKGWTLKVDGKDTKIEKTIDLFMSASVSKGEHTYEMIYLPPYLPVGAGISAVAFAGLLVIMLCHLRTKRGVLR